MFAMWMTEKKQEELVINKEFAAVKLKYIDLYKINVSDLMGVVKGSTLYSDAELLEVVSNKYYDLEKEDENEEESE